MGVAMIKTGLYRVDQLSSSAKIRGFFGGTRRVSITLYEKLHEMKKAEEWAEKILFSYCDARGIFKRTYADRFDQFDDMAIDCLGREFPASRALTMWINSPEHKANMLNGRWREIGISAVHSSSAPGTYSGRPVTIVTTDFGVRR